MYLLGAALVAASASVVGLSAKTLVGIPTFNDFNVTTSTSQFLLSRITAVLVDSRFHDSVD